jgi:NADH-quinone oxidoreductase subunit K
MNGSEPVLNNYLIVGALLFTLGLVGFLARRNLIVMFLCAELMLQGVSLTLVAFGGFHGDRGGQVFAIFSLALAAAEAGIALALFVVVFRRGSSLDVSIWQDLREEDQPPVVDESAADTLPAEASWPHLPAAGRLPEKAPETDGRAQSASGSRAVSPVSAAGAKGGGL